MLKALSGRSRLSTAKSNKTALLLLENGRGISFNSAEIKQLLALVEGVPVTIGNSVCVVNDSIVSISGNNHGDYNVHFNFQELQVQYA